MQKTASGWWGKLISRVLLAAIIALTAAMPLAADIIVLKSGRRIEAWGIEERGDRVYYETPEGRVGLPKRLVERIERSDALPRWGGAGASAIADLPPAELPALGDADVQRVVEGGEINRDLLGRLEREAEGGSEAARLRAAAGHVLAARLLAERNDPVGASESLRRALRYLPNHPVLLLHLASLEAEQQRYGAALDRLRLILDDPEVAFQANRLRGWIYYQQEDMARALAAWKRALAVRSDAELEALVARVEREARAVERYRDQASGRFLLRYEGSEVASQRLVASIMDALDSMHDSLASTFNVMPREPIVVLLYPNETFYELTGTLPWVHGLYDGKIRIPVKGLVSLTPRLEQVLRHELVHAFVFLKTRNRAPRWLQEGLAQFHAGQSPSISRQSFRPLFELRDGSALPRIEGGFGGEAEQVLAAYAAALVVVEALERRYGSGDMERFLTALGRGETLQQALRSAYRLTLVDLDREVYDFLR
jgi:tetratricopeptide (TPR) repeat protein